MIGICSKVSKVQGRGGRRGSGRLDSKSYFGEHKSVESVLQDVEARAGMCICSAGVWEREKERKKVL